MEMKKSSRNVEQARLGNIEHRPASREGSQQRDLSQAIEASASHCKPLKKCEKMKKCEKQKKIFRKTEKKCEKKEKIVKK